MIFAFLIFTMPIQIIKEKVNIEEIKKSAEEYFGDFTKAVVDIENGIMAIGGELHADVEVLLSEQGSKRENLWGINLYPEKSGEEFIEFDSMINIKPQYNNRSRGVENSEIQEKIRAVVDKLVER